MTDSKFKKLIVTGTARWAKVQEVDRKYPDEKTGGGSWEITVDLDPESVQAVKKSGHGHRMKETEEGQKYVKLKRKELKLDGEARTPPKVIDNQTNEFKGLIGNGSKVKVLAYLYPNKTTPTQMEAMLDTVQVIELVPYKKKEDFQPVGSSGFSQDDGAPFDLDLDKKASSM